MRRSEEPATTVRLDGDAGLPRYRRLRDIIAGQLARGELRPGDALPAEQELARRYGLATGTVRRAIDELSERGLVERRHGSGTFVRRPNFDHMMVRFFLHRDAFGNVFEPESQIVFRQVVIADEALGERLGTAAGGHAIHMVRLRSWDGAPRLIEDIYLPLPRFQAFLDAEAGSIEPLLYRAYERLCGVLVFAIEEEIAITDATAADHTALHLPDRTPVVEIERQARDAAGSLVEWRRSRAEARRFRYRIAMVPTTS